MKNIIWLKPDGGIAVVSIGALQSVDQIMASTDMSLSQATKRHQELYAAWPIDSQHHAEQLWNRCDVPLDWIAVAFDIEEIPIDPDFDDARVWDGARVVFDLTRAKEVKKNQLRAQREPLFRLLDGQRAVAVRAGTGTAVIDAEAQRLADITALVDVVETLDELRSIKCEIQAEID